MHNPLFTKARSRLVLDNPFFGTLCLRLKPVERDDIDTGAVDGVHLFYNPKWFEKLKDLERIGFLAHEVMHVVFLHITRRQERDPKKWNVAADYAINNYLIAEHFQLPKGGLVDDQYNDMTTEAIYNLLPEPPQGWDSISSDFGGCGGVLDHPNAGTKESTGAIEAGLTVAINQAAEAAKAQGKLSGNLETLVMDIGTPKVDWKAVLARFLRANNKSDFTWARPNRRFIAQGLYLPSMHNPCLEHIAIVHDSSGSVSEDELSQFLTETSSILRDLNPDKIQLIQCDTEVTSDVEYTRESLPLQVKYKGRGGTMFSPAIDYVNEKYPNVAALIYLTDLECDDFGDEPNYPVLWVTTQQGETPYGEVIKM